PAAVSRRRRPDSPVDRVVDRAGRRARRQGNAPLGRDLCQIEVPHVSGSHRPRVVMVSASLEILGGHGVQAAALAEGLGRDGYAVALLPINPRFPRGLRWVRRHAYVRTLLNEALFLPSLWSLRRADVAHIFSASYWSFLLGPVPAIEAARH